MKAAVVRRPRDMKVEEIDVPKLQPNEVLIAVMACGLCHADLRWFLGTSSPPMGYPSVLGHEPSGRVVAVGEKVGNVGVGTRVTFYHLRNCGSCYYCRMGKGNLCIRREPFIGAFAEYTKTVESQVCPIPDSCSYLEAAFAEPLACCLNGIEKLRIRPGYTVLIIGAGPMGLMLTQLAKLAGATVLVSEPLEGRRNLALSLGADETINPASEDVPSRVKSLTDGRGADGVLPAIGSEKAIYEGLTSVRKLGTLVIFGAIWPETTISLNPNIIHYGEINLTGAESSTLDQFFRAATLISHHKVKAKELVSHILPLSRINEGIAIMLSKSAGKVVISPEVHSDGEEDTQNE